MRSTFFPSRQGSSAVEQGTHKPLVGSSILPPGISVYGMGVYFAWIIRAALYWFDARFGARLAQHRRGHTHTTKRIGEFQVVAQREYSTLKEARDTERLLKAKRILVLQFTF